MWIAAIILLLLASPLVIAMMRANELFVMKIHEGQALLVRGRIPPRLLTDIGDVVRGVATARLRCISESGKPAVYSDGVLGPVEMQRLRNLIGTWTVAQIRSGALR